MQGSFKEYMEMMRCKKLKANKVPTQLMDLPMDMLVNILLRLPVESLHRIQCVSKPLLNTVGTFSFIKQHTLSLIAVNNSHVVHRVPQLMCSNYTSTLAGEETYDYYGTLQSLRYDGGTALTKGRCTFTHTISSNSFCEHQPNFVFYNLFCISCSENGQCLLVNPLLRQVLQLPTDNIQQLTAYGPNYHVYIGSYGMGFDKTTNTYKIVRFSSIHNTHDSSTLGKLTHVLQLGTNSWREIPVVPPKHLCIFYNLCAYGDMHWLLKRTPGGDGVTKSHIITFDFEREEFRFTPTPPTLRSSNKDSDLHLLTLRGSMAIAETFPFPEGGGMKVEIWVMKDYVKKEWAREYNINVDMKPEFELKYATCGEWEHGIFFSDRSNSSLRSDGTTRLFVDLRSASVNLAVCPIETEMFTNITSFTGSLISLRDYGCLDYTDEPPDDLVARLKARTRV